MKFKLPQSPPKSKDEPKSRGNIIDAFVKRMFSRMVVFVDFLTCYADPEFVAVIDPVKIEPAPTHYTVNGNKLAGFPREKYHFVPVFSIHRQNRG